MLAGGVGAARLLAGMVHAVDEADITVIGNTGDDLELYGLHISPDLDTVTYTTSGNINGETGWGLKDESWEAMAALRRFPSDPWFNLGDRDLATHLYQTSRLPRAGASLSAVTAEDHCGIRIDVASVADDRRCRLRTRRIELQDGKERGRVPGGTSFASTMSLPCGPCVTSTSSLPSRPAYKGVLEALDAADTVIVIAPSNPILSLGPILARYLASRRRLRVGATR